MKTVLVGLSGGVDSSVTAALLKERGYNVIGAFMKNWDGDSCNWAQESTDAMLIAEQLNIPFKIIDFKKEYKDLIINYLIKEYKEGRTPNPDVYCNKLIKFGIFWEAFKSLNIDYIATGHYASTDGEFIYAGVDKNKDQSYFLSNVTKEQIKRMILPLGIYTKSEVRAMAKTFNLHTYNKKDSQGICFIGKTNFQKFLSNYIKDKNGVIMDKNNTIIGNHNGIHHYTIGQRKNLNINKQGPWFVSKLNSKKNIVHVVHENEKNLLLRNNFTITNTTWYTSENFYECKVVVKYHDKAYPCRVKGNLISIDSSIKGIQIAPGQFAVFYNGNKLIGSGVISF